MLRGFPILFWYATAHSFQGRQGGIELRVGTNKYNKCNGSRRGITMMDLGAAGTGFRYSCYMQ